MTVVLDTELRTLYWGENNDVNNGQGKSAMLWLDNYPFFSTQWSFFLLAQSRASPGISYNGIL
jgi:hypothetical protein